MNKNKRNKIKRIRKKKFRKLKNTGMLSHYYKQKEPKVVKSEPKVQEIKQKTMPTIKKMLGFLPSDKPWARVARRFIVIGVFAAISAILRDVISNFGTYIPQGFIPIFTAILAAMDKEIRELKRKLELKGK